MPSVIVHGIMVLLCCLFCAAQGYITDDAELKPSESLAMLLAGVASPVSAHRSPSVVIRRRALTHTAGEDGHRYLGESTESSHAKWADSTLRRDMPPSLLRLRGGGILSAIYQGLLGIPVLTRCWMFMALILASANQAGFIEPDVLALDPYAITMKRELWRPITAASFFGGIGGQLLNKLVYLVQFGGGVEHAIGISEYARALASCAAMLCVIFNVLGWQLIGDALVMAMTVLNCQQNPDALMSLYGLKIPVVFTPFTQMLMTYLFSQQIPWTDIVGAIVGYIHYFIQDQVKPDAVIARRQAVKEAKEAKDNRRTVGGSGGRGKLPRTTKR